MQDRANAGRGGVSCQSVVGACWKAQLDFAMHRLVIAGYGLPGGNRLDDSFLQREQMSRLFDHQVQA